MKYKVEKTMSARIGSIEFTILKSKRKTLCIYVQPDQSVEVKAPVEMKKKEIVDWVRTKENWIRKKQLEIQQKKVRQYEEGELFPYLGEEYPLHIVYDENCEKIRVNIARKRLTVVTNTMDKERIKDIIKKWYVENAKRRYFGRVWYYRRYIHDWAKCIYIKELETHWGTCSSQKNISFNWKAIMAPPEILDYIVVHEMCHLKYMDHSQEFWKAVEKVLPDYKQRKKWLKDNGKYLEL